MTENKYVKGWIVNRKEGGKKKTAKERIYLNHSGPFPIVFSLLPPSAPFSPYPYNIPPQVQSSPLSLRSLFSTVFLPLWCPSVGSCLVVSV